MADKGGTIAQKQDIGFATEHIKCMCEGSRGDGNLGPEKMKDSISTCQGCGITPNVIRTNLDVSTVCKGVESMSELTDSNSPNCEILSPAVKRAITIYSHLHHSDTRSLPGIRLGTPMLTVPASSHGIGRRRVKDISPLALGFITESFREYSPSRVARPCLPFYFPVCSDRAHPSDISLLLIYLTG